MWVIETEMTKMTEAQILELAKMAIQGMEPAEKAAFIKFMDDGHENVASLLTKATALRTINRNIAMANMAICDPRIMADLTAAVEAA